MSETLETRQASANARRAASFFKQPVWTRLLDAIYHKYIAQGRIGGQVTLQHCTAGELQEIARFMGKRIPINDEITVRLSDFQARLSTTGLDCSLPDLLLACFPERPQTTLTEQRAQRVRSQQDFPPNLTAIAQTLPPDAKGAQWLLQGSHGQEALFQRYKNKTPAAQAEILQQIRSIAQGLNQLPTPPQFERLALFAQQISGDPHFLDANTTTGRLFLQALGDISQQANILDINDEELDKEASAPQSPEQDQQRLLRYYEAGLLMDTISSNVAVAHLAYAEDHTGTPDPLITYAGQRVLSLPLRQLLSWQRLDPATENVYLVENPQVFERIIDATVDVTLICTAGWPSIATIQLLNLLIASRPTITLYYSGDFDIQGIRIAAYFHTRYPQCQLWRFDADTYHAALHSQAKHLDSHELAALHNLPDTFAPLLNAMQAEKQKAYQEGIVSLLIEDIGLSQRTKGERA